MSKCLMMLGKGEKKTHRVVYSMTIPGQLGHLVVKLCDQISAWMKVKIPHGLGKGEINII